MYSQNMMNRVADVVVAVTLLITTLEKTGRSRPVKDSVKRSVFLCCKKISSAPRLNSANRGARARRVETSEEEEERACDTSLLTHLPSGATPHLICWSTSLPTSHVGLNLAPTSCLCAANNLGCITNGLTHMGFEISRNF
jgi:hypothetical protein